MKLFEVVYLLQGPDPVTRQVQARDRADLKSRLPTGATVKSIRELREKNNKPLLTLPPPAWEKVLFYKQLYAMQNAGVMLSTSLRTLEQQTVNHVFKQTLRSMVTAIEEGGIQLSEACAQHPSIFNAVEVHMLQVGEKSGKVEVVFQELSVILDKDRKLKAKVQSAMIYPVLVMLLTCGIGGYLMIKVVPQFTEILTGMGGKLPLITQITLGASFVLQHYWWALLLLLSAVAYGLYTFYQRPQGRLLLDRLVLKIPIAGPMLQKTILTRFSRSTSVMITSGVDLLQTLKIQMGVVGNRVYQESLERVIKDLSSGVALHEALAFHTELYPPIMISMLHTGILGGNQGEMFHQVAAFFEDIVNETAENLTKTIEPILTIGIGLFVGTIVMSLFLPYYGIIGQLNSTSR